VQRNPWLLADTGQVNRNVFLDLGFAEIEMSGSMALLPRQRAKLVAERDAGTLFPKG
jgi:hypothetical protein